MEKGDDLAQESTIISDISNIPDHEQSHDNPPFNYSTDMFLETSYNKIKATL